MFDIGWPEMLVVGVIALFVVGPKELPRVLMTCAKYWRQVRGIALDFRGQFDDLIREAELDEVRRQVTDATKVDLPNKIDIDTIAGGPTTRKTTSKFEAQSSSSGVGAAESLPMNNPGPAAEPVSEPAPQKPDMSKTETNR